MHHKGFIVDGEAWPSATELTSLLPQAWLWSWYKHAVKTSGWRGWQKCLAQSKRGMKIGTEVHSLIESFINKEPYEASGKYDSQSFADALFDKVNPSVDKWIDIEPHVVSNDLKIHGTADAVALINNEAVLLDWKTSAAKSETHPIQLAIYAYCWNETRAEDPDCFIERGIIARVDKKSKKLGVKLDVYENLAQYDPVIKALRVIWDYTKQQGPFKPTEA